MERSRVPEASAGSTVEKVLTGQFYMMQVETKVDSEQLKVQANSCQYCAKQQVLA